MSKPMSAPASPFHNRLDLKLNVFEYTDAPCGSLNAKTGEPEYCTFSCPVLHGKEPSQAAPSQEPA